jgi:predicted GNAT superfamily acetyltransferase
VEIKVKSFQTTSEQKDARRIFDQTWAMGSGTEITPNLLQAMVHSGAYLSGAFMDDKCVGAAFAFPATTGGLHLHSHMTAVLGEYRDQGVGYALKVDQWHWAKKNNFPEISWTFDPLVSRNAKLNLIKLGVNISSYHPNFYGDMPDALNAGDESDRLMVSWKVLGDNPLQRELVSATKPTDILIQIPADIVAIRSRDREENLRWRRKVRGQFLQVFEKGGQVIGFSANLSYVYYCYLLKLQHQILACLFE